MGFFTSVKKKISSSFKKSSKNNTKKNIKTRTLTPYNKLYPIEEEENEDQDQEKSLTSKKDSSPKKKTSSPKKSSSPKSPTPESILVKVHSKSPEKVEEIELKFPEPLPDKINFDEKVANKMNTIFNKHKDIKQFSPVPFLKILFYLYLFKKYKSNCLITQNIERMNVPEVFLFYDVNKKNPDDTKMDDARFNKFVNQLVKCISENEPVIIIPFNLQIQMQGMPLFGHENLLIYRNNKRELEHFEPHGQRFDAANMSNDNTKFNEYVQSYLKNMVGLINSLLDKKGLPDIKLVHAYDVCPRLKGLQALEGESKLPKLPIEPGGYCVAWSMFFAEMCLKNPEIPSRQIYDAMLKETIVHDKNYLRKVIRGYTCFINNKMAKYFSKVFDDDITSAKIIEYTNENNKPNFLDRKDEAKQFMSKLNFIMENEINPSTYKNRKLIEELRNVEQKYNTFKNTIQKDTSSSDLDKTKNKSKKQQLKLEDKRQKATEKEEEKLRKATEKEEEKLRKTTEKQQKLEEKLLSKTAKSRPKTSKAKTLKMTTSPPKTTSNP
jgi:hypothetical protein